MDTHHSQISAVKKLFQEHAQFQRFSGTLPLTGADTRQLVTGNNA